MDRRSSHQQLPGGSDHLNKAINHRLDDPEPDDQQAEQSSNQMIPLRQESLADWSAKVSQSTTEKKQVVLDTKYFRLGSMKNNNFLKNIRSTEIDPVTVLTYSPCILPGV